MLYCCEDGLRSLPLICIKPNIAMLCSYKHAYIAEFCKNTDCAGANHYHQHHVHRQKKFAKGHLEESVRSQMIPVYSEPFNQKQVDEQVHLLQQRK